MIERNYLFVVKSDKVYFQLPTTTKWDDNEQKLLRGAVDKTCKRKCPRYSQDRLSFIPNRCQGVSFINIDDKLVYQNNLGGPVTSSENAPCPLTTTPVTIP